MKTVSSDTRIKAGALLFFSVLTVFHLYPLSFHPADGVNETIDSLLNSWIISWVQRNILSNPLGLFHANIFFPHPNTLSFSEHLIPQALISFPVFWLSRNPVLVYNFVFFFSYILSAFGMFLLVRYLTQSNLSGIACGIMFAFNTFQIHHITHLQLLSLGLTPLAFLYLHKYFDEKKLKQAILFSLFFTLQALACIYYGLFFVSILVIIFPALLALKRTKLNLPFLAKLGVPLVFSAAILLFFSLPYKSLFKSFGLERHVERGADPMNYLGTNPHNVFLHKVLTPLGTHEHFLFPGIAVLFLAGFFIFLKKKFLYPLPKAVKIFVWLVVFVILSLAVFVKCTGGFSIKAGLFSLSAHNTAKQGSFLLLLGIVYLMLSFFYYLFNRRGKESAETHNFFVYLLLGAWAFLLSLGKNFTFLGHTTSIFPLPFSMFFAYVPGFKGIRVPARYAAFVIFGLVVLAGYGLKSLLEKVEKRKAVAIAAGLLLFLNLEYLTIPQRMHKVPVSKEIPPTYTWLKSLPGNFAIAELPLPPNIGKETAYMYFSIFHRKKLLNGYSGFIPQTADYFRKIFAGFPSSASIDILRSLGVKYVILHPRLWEEDVAARKMERLLSDFSGEMRLVRKFQYKLRASEEGFGFFGEDFVFEVVPLEGKEEEAPQDYEEIPPSDWKVTASTNEDLLPFLKDGIFHTRWTTSEVKQTGDYLLVELKELQEVAKISLYLGKYTYDYAIDLIVHTPQEGDQWERINKNYSRGDFAKNLVYSPLNPVQDIYLRKNEIRYLRITQLGYDKEFWWSVAEMKIYRFKEGD